MDILTLVLTALAVLGAAQWVRKRQDADELHSERLELEDARARLEPLQDEERRVEESVEEIDAELQRVREEGTRDGGPLEWLRSTEFGDSAGENPQGD